MLAFFDVGREETVEGPDFSLKRSHTYQTPKVQEPEKTNNNSEKGERRNVGGGAERRGSEPTQTDTRFETFIPGKIINSSTQKI